VKGWTRGRALVHWPRWLVRPGRTHCSGIACRAISSPGRG